MGTSFLLFIDDFFGLQNDKGRVMQAVAERTEHLRPQDRVAVVAWDGRNLTLLSDWTDSAQVVNDAIDASMARQSKGLQREAERRQWLDQRAVVANAPGRRARYFHGARYRLGAQEEQYAHLLVSQLQAAVGAASAVRRDTLRFEVLERWIRFHLPASAPLVGQ